MKIQTVQVLEKNMNEFVFGLGVKKERLTMTQKNRGNKRKN
jgi:regulator of PEP synthase PpsR (kinase-PPPase family)